MLICRGKYDNNNNLNHNIVNYLRNLITFAEKYNVDSFEEIEDKILMSWDQEHIIMNHY